MAIASLITIAASKWVLVGKIMIAVGSGLVTAAPVLDKKVKRKKHSTH